MAGVSADGWRHGYVGPAELLGTVRPTAEGRVVRSAGDLDGWLAGRAEAELAEPFTYVVGLDGLLRLAPRRSEHVACAGGADVLGAGEMGFERAAGRSLPQNPRTKSPWRAKLISRHISQRRTGSSGRSVTCPPVTVRTSTIFPPSGMSLRKITA